jgi:hypothetical protein
MRPSILVCCLALGPQVALLSAILPASFATDLPAGANVNVAQFHNHDSRDGLYIDPAFTLETAAKLTRDLNFDGTIVGNVYAQPLYIEGGPGGKAMVIVVTESNNVYALDALDGTIIWQRNVGDPVDAGELICSKFDPMGIIGTPIVDLPSRALFLDAMITPDGGATKKHLIFSLDVDTGDINPGWPVDVEETVSYNGVHFTAEIQQQRPALGIVGGILYVGYGSMADCNVYHGWLVGVPIDNPAGVTAWASATSGGAWRGAIWGVGGVASDGKNPFVTTGNTINTHGNWDGGEAIIRFQPGPIFSGDTGDYWAPENWLDLDNADIDLGGCGPLLVDVPGATPSHLVVALGKDGNAYLVDRDNLGGISPPIASTHFVNGFIIQAAVTYRTQQVSYVAFRASRSSLTTFHITATDPPTIVSSWTATRQNGGCGSPFVTSTDGSNNMIVWVVGTEDHGNPGDQRLHGYDGQTGAVVYAGGGPDELMAGTHFYSTTGIAARGRIYVAGDNKVYAFMLPAASPTPTPASTPSPTLTPTPTPSSSPTPTGTPTSTTTPTPTVAPTVTPTPSVTPGVTPTQTPATTPTPTPTPTVTPATTPTPAVTPTPTITPVPTPTTTPTSTPSVTPAPTVTPSATPRARPTPRPRPTPPPRATPRR